MPVLMRLFSFVLLLGCSVSSQAIWFEASGQAVIENGNKEVARQKATQEAIQQALLFAGASVRSVQKMANGLLESDSFEIRTTGEVNALELIDEIYTSDYVTVSIRADIFPQDAQCQASDYQKSIATAWFPISSRQQAAVGGIYDLGMRLPVILEQHLNRTGQYANIKSIEPYYVHMDYMKREDTVVKLARRSNAQYVVIGAINELSIESRQQSTLQSLSFWKDNHPTRHFAVTVALFDGQTGAQIHQKRYAVKAPWEFDYHQVIDVQSEAMWDSSFGRTVSELFHEVSQDIDEAISCSPAYGRVLSVRSEHLQINIGSDMGVRNGDELTLFQLNQFYDPMGQMHYQYNIHPTKVRVTSTYPTSAVVTSIDGSLLANIQPNDFVARQ